MALICYVILVSLLFIFVERDQDWSFTDSFYFTWVMITTVGYGDLAPKSEFGRLSIIPLFIVGGAIMFMISVPSITVCDQPWAAFVEKSRGVTLGSMCRR